MEKEFKIGNMKVTVQYDETKFDIVLIGDEKRIIVRRISDNVILKSFINVGFIVQTVVDGKNHFIVSEYSKAENKVDENMKLVHYIESPRSNTLKLVNEFDTDSIWLENNRIMDNAYIIGPNYYSKKIYNLKNTSVAFKKVFSKKNITDRFDDKTILVNREMSASLNYQISDILTYGINLETLEIATPIWSDLQQRLFTVYTDEERSILNKKYIEKGYWGINEKLNNEEVTFHFEEQQYLDMLANHLERGQNVYKDLSESMVNEEFIKKFKKNS